MDYAMLGRTKVAEEFGWWAGVSALRIIDGEPVSSIPITTNKRSKVFLNMELAKKSGIIFPFELLQEAGFLEQPAEEATE